MLRSAAVGVTATLLDLAILATLVHAFDVGPRVASPLGLIAGVAVQFVGNKIYAFRDRPSGGIERWGAQGLAFLGVEAVAFALNALGFDLVVATTHLPALPVRIVVSSAVYFIFCLPLWSRLFRPRAGLRPFFDPAPSCASPPLVARGDGAHGRFARSAAPQAQVG